jgi:hypothetical protein
MEARQQRSRSQITLHYRRFFKSQPLCEFAGEYNSSFLDAVALFLFPLPLSYPVSYPLLLL